VCVVNYHLCRLLCSVPHKLLTVLHFEIDDGIYADFKESQAEVVLRQLPSLRTLTIVGTVGERARMLIAKQAPNCELVVKEPHYDTYDDETSFCHCFDDIDDWSEEEEEEEDMFGALFDEEEQYEVHQYEDQFEEQYEDHFEDQYGDQNLTGYSRKNKYAFKNGGKGNRPFK